MSRLLTRKVTIISLAVAAVIVVGGIALASTGASSPVRTSAKKHHIRRNRHAHIDGMVIRVAASSVTVKTTSGFTSFTLNARTKVSEMAPATLTSVRPGNCVKVTGPSNSIGTVQATSVVIDRSSSTGCTAHPRHTRRRTHHRSVTGTSGTVVSVSGSTVEIQNPEGQVGVTILPATRISRIAALSTKNIVVGRCVVVELRHTRHTTGASVATLVSVRSPTTASCKLGGPNTRTSHG